MYSASRLSPLTFRVTTATCASCAFLSGQICGFKASLKKKKLPTVIKMTFVCMCPAGSCLQPGCTFYATSGYDLLAGHWVQED